MRLFLPLISGISAPNSTSSPCLLAPFSQPPSCSQVVSSVAREVFKVSLTIVSSFLFLSAAVAVISESDFRYSENPAVSFPFHSSHCGPTTRISCLWGLPCNSLLSYSASLPSVSPSACAKIAEHTYLLSSHLSSGSYLAPGLGITTYSTTLHWGHLFSLERYFPRHVCTEPLWDAPPQIT